MSILIKGMPMPKSCWDCPFGKEKQFDVGIICTLLDGTTFDTTSRPTSMCPLIEFPPHGRLIDADAMEKEVCGECKHGEHKYENCIECALANAPTIIESEGDE